MSKVLYEIDGAQYQTTIHDISILLDSGLKEPRRVEIRNPIRIPKNHIFQLIVKRKYTRKKKTEG